MSTGSSPSGQRTLAISSKFDALFATAAPLIRAQRHVREAPPRPGGRWPVSVLLRPGPELGQKLADLADDAATIAGTGHWLTGCRAGAHVTIRALERYRDDLAPDDPATGRYRRALHAAANQCRPITLRVIGLTLASGSVLACLESQDGSAERLRDDVLPRELGRDAWLENELGRRDLWHLTLVHFAADIADPDRLISWVEPRRELDLGTTTISTVELVRFRYDASTDHPFMRPETLDRAPLAAAP